MRTVLILAGLCLALAGCSTTPTPQKCVPPQQWVNDGCVDRDGSGDGQGQPDGPADPAVPTIKRR